MTTRAGSGGFSGFYQTRSMSIRSIQAAMGATLVNVCIPVMLLWLATRRRFWSMRLLLALPVVVAVIMAGSSALISLFPDILQPSPTPWRGLVFSMALLSMSGLPVVAYTVAFVLALVHRRWKKIGVLVAGAVLVAVLILTLTLWAVSHAKPAIEHYNWSGWHQALIWGAYVAGVLMLAARAARAAGRFVLSLARTAPPWTFQAHMKTTDPAADARFDPVVPARTRALSKLAGPAGPSSG